MTAPVDIVFEILLWLPVMSLLRFKSVCESWRGLIENRRFIAQHMNHHSRVGDCVILVKRRPTKDDADSIFLLSGEKNFEEAPQIQDLPPYIKDDSDLQLVAYCRGIICLYDAKYGNLSLWNPATREFRALPLSPVVFPPVLRHRLRIRHGLGFDVKTNDFKVVRIIVFAGECGNFKEQVEVYNLSSNSWRIIHPSFPPTYKSFIHGSDPKVELNGLYSWLVRNNSVFYDVVIVSFDFVNEVLQVMALPDDCRENWSFTNYLAVLNNEPKIAFMCQVGRGSHRYDFEFWVLNEFGVKESWAKVYTFGPFLTFTTLVGFSKNGEVLLFNRKGQLALCNLITKEIKNLYVLLETTSLEALIYKESLATLHPLTVELHCCTQ